MEDSQQQPLPHVLEETTESTTEETPSHQQMPEWMTRLAELGVSNLNIYTDGRVEVCSITMRNMLVSTHEQCTEAAQLIGQGNGFTDTIVGTIQGLLDFHSKDVARYPTRVIECLTEHKGCWEKPAEAMLQCAVSSIMAMMDHIRTMESELFGDDDDNGSPIDGSNQTFKLGIVVPGPWFPKPKGNGTDLSESREDMLLCLDEFSARLAIPCYIPSTLSQIGSICGRAFTRITPQNAAAVRRAISIGWNAMALPATGYSSCVAVFAQAGVFFFSRRTGFLLDGLVPSDGSGSSAPCMALATVCDCMRNAAANETVVFDCQLAGGADVRSMPHSARLSAAREALSDESWSEHLSVTIADFIRRPSTERLATMQRIAFVNNDAPYPTTERDNNAYVWKEPSIPLDCAVLMRGSDCEAMALKSDGEPLLRSVGTMVFTSQEDVDRDRGEYSTTAYVCRPYINTEDNGDDQTNRKKQRRWLWMVVRAATNKEPITTRRECYKIATGMTGRQCCCSTAVSNQKLVVNREAICRIFDKMEAVKPTAKSCGPAPDFIMKVLRRRKRRNAAKMATRMYSLPTYNSFSPLSVEEECFASFY